MLRTTILIFVSALSGLAQTPAKDPPSALEALLIEVKQLRQDIESMTVASQRVQIALYGLQMQDGAVSRGSQRLDDLRNKRIQTESARDKTASDIARTEAALPSVTDPREAEALRGHVQGMKKDLESLNTEVQTRQAAEAEGASQLRTEQGKLTELQDRIQRLDGVLQKLGTDGK